MFGFGKSKPSPEAMLTDLVEHNADQIARSEGKDRTEATYLAICLIFDDMMSKGSKQGYQDMMDLVQTRYVQHMKDVVTYIAWTTGRIALSPEADAAMVERNQ